MNAVQLEARLIAVLSLAACAPQSIDPVLTDPGALDEPSAEQPRQARTSTGTLAVLGTAGRWSSVAVELSDLPEGEILLVASMRRGSNQVNGIRTDLWRPTVVARLAGGGARTQVAEGPHGQPAAVGSQILLQAVSTDGSWATRVQAADVTMFEQECGDSVMAGTFTNQWSEGQHVVACDLNMVPGLCEPASMVDGTIALYDAARIGPDLYTVGEGCFKPNALSACCYSFPLEVTPNPDRMEVLQRGGNGGGGGGGGGSWDGRPFRVHGEVRHAEIVATGQATEAMDCPPELREQVAAAWTTAALQEHSSIAAFARFALELVQLGAPVSLLADASRAQLDEVRHTALALDMAARLTGEVLRPTPISMEGALEGRDLRTVTLDVVHEGCINETVSALIALEARDAAVDAQAHAALTEIAEDESRHAELAWRFVRWALDQPGTEGLRSDVLAALSGFEVGAAPEPNPQAEGLAAFGVLSRCRRHRVALRAQEVIARCAAALG